VPGRSPARRPRRVAVAAALVSAALLIPLAPGPLPAQEAGAYTFVMRFGSDTIGSEVVRRDPGRLEVDMANRLGGGPVHFVLALGPDAAVSAMSAQFYRSASDTAPAQSIDLRFEGDSAIATLSGATSRVDRMATGAGAVPYLNPSAALVEQILRRARAMGGARGAADTVPVLALQGGTTLQVDVRWPSADEAVLHLAGIEMHATVSEDGRLLELAIPVQNVRVARVEGAHPLRAEEIDYGPPEDAPYAAEDVTVHTPAGLDLTGTLTLPDTSAGPVPAVVTITGSGAEDRDERIPFVRGYRPFWEIADTLGRRGIATLRLDDRGVNGSSPGPDSATSEDYADDVRAAVAWLRDRPGIDGSRIGLVGHSEGGMIAPMVAATDSSLAGIVLMAGTAYDGRRILRYQLRSAIRRSGAYTPAERDSALEAVPDRIDAMAKGSAWTRFFLEHDPVATAGEVGVPVLILQGETDRQVSPEQADTLAAAFREGGDADVTLRKFADTNHLFLADPNGAPEGYATLPSHSVRPEVLGAIADWLSNRLEAGETK